jgi:hypothetical protein
MERSEIRELRSGFIASPGFASLNPGYEERKK